MYFVLCKAQAEMKETVCRSGIKVVKSKTKTSNCKAIRTEKDCGLCGLQGEGEKTL